MSGAGSGIAGGQGSSSFAALELLANPTQLQARIDSLKAAEERANDVIALAGPAHEILQLREAIENDVAKAKEDLAACHEECESLISGANDSARNIIDKATQEATSLEGQMRDRAARTEAALNEAQASLASLKKEPTYLDQREATLTSDREQLVSKETDLDSRESLLLQEKSKLATVREHIDQVLG